MTYNANADGVGDGVIDVTEHDHLVYTTEILHSCQPPH